MIFLQLAILKLLPLPSSPLSLGTPADVPLLVRGSLLGDFAEEDEEQEGGEEEDGVEEDGQLPFASLSCCCPPHSPLTRSVTFPREEEDAAFLRVEDGEVRLFFCPSGGGRISLSFSKSLFFSGEDSVHLLVALIIEALGLPSVLLEEEEELRRLLLLESFNTFEGLLTPPSPPFPSPPFLPPGSDLSLRPISLLADGDPSLPPAFLTREEEQEEEADAEDFAGMSGGGTETVGGPPPGGDGRELRDAVKGEGEEQESFNKNGLTTPGVCTPPETRGDEGDA